jgi:hypothetical protein
MSAYPSSPLRAADDGSDDEGYGRSSYPHDDRSPPTPTPTAESRRLRREMYERARAARQAREETTRGHATRRGHGESVGVGKSSTIDLEVGAALDADAVRYPCSPRPAPTSTMGAPTRVVWHPVAVPGMGHRVPSAAMALASPAPASMGAPALLSPFAPPGGVVAGPTATHPFAPAPMSPRPMPPAQMGYFVAPGPAAGPRPVFAAPVAAIDPLLLAAGGTPAPGPVGVVASAGYMPMVVVSAGQSLGKFSFASLPSQHIGCHRAAVPNMGTDNAGTSLPLGRGGQSAFNAGNASSTPSRPPYSPGGYPLIPATQLARPTGLYFPSHTIHPSLYSSLNLPTQPGLLLPSANRAQQVNFSNHSSAGQQQFGDPSSPGNLVSGYGVFFLRPGPLPGYNSSSLPDPFSRSPAAPVGSQNQPRSESPPFDLDNPPSAPRKKKY